MLTNRQRLIVGFLFLLCCALFLWRLMQHSAAPSLQIRKESSDRYCSNKKTLYTFPDAAQHPQTVCSLKIASTADLRTFMQHKDSFTNLHRLIIIDVDDARLPAEFGSLPMLTDLLIQETENTFLPKEIGKLPYLEHLSLVHNDVFYLPPEIGSITSLQTISIINCPHLTTLPVSIHKLSNLSSFTIHAVPVIVFSDTFSLPLSITSLVLSADNLQTVPAFVFRLPKLQSLDISTNAIDSVPPQLMQMRSLEILRMRNNPFSSLPDMHELDRLQSFDVTGSSLHQLPPGIETLSSIRFAGFAETDIPKSALAHLKKKLSRAVITE